MTFNIPPLSNALDSALQHKIDNKTKPLGALGQMERLALQIGRIQHSLTPAFNKPHILVLASDHGAAKVGVSAYPQEVTWQMVENFLAGGAAINVFARQNGLSLTVVDAGVAHEFGPREGLIDAKINPAGTRNYIEEPAMSAEECAAALARSLADAGCNVLGFGEMGIGNTASASLVTHALIGTPLAECIGRGTGLDDAGLARKRELLARAVERAALPADADVMNVLAEFGGFEIVTSALLAAARIAPAIREYCIFCHQSAEPGHLVQLHGLAADPLIDMGLRLGEGTGAALVWPLVNAAAAFLRDMASFESAGVSEKC